jgi:type IV secretory pathway TrbD component
VFCSITEMQVAQTAALASVGGVCLYYIQPYKSLATVAATFPCSALLLLFLVYRNGDAESRPLALNDTLRKLAVLYGTLAIACAFLYVSLDWAAARFGASPGTLLVCSCAVFLWTLGACSVVYDWA